MKTVPYLLLALLFMSQQAVSATIPVEIKVEGVTGQIRENVLAYLSLEQQKDSELLTPGQIRRLYNKAPEEIRAALEPFGYYRFSVEAELEEREAGWLAHFRIDPGPPLKLSDVDLLISGEGADDPEFKKLAQAFPVKKGQSLRHAEYEAGKAALQTLAVERGYLDAKLKENEIRVDFEKYDSSIVLHFDTGPRYRFGAVSFDQRGFNEDFLRRFVVFETGDSFTTASVLDLQNALSDSDYFARIEVDARRDLATNLRIPVEVRLTPKKSSKYTFGIGYGTDTGVRGSVAWERRRINARGHRLNVELEASQISNRLTGRYRIPLENPRTDQFTFNVGVSDENTDTSESQIGLIGASRIVKRGEWTETFSLNLQRELFEVADEPGRSTLLIPSGSWSHIRADNRIYTTRGSRVQFDVRGAAESLLSDTSFVQGRAQGKLIRKVGADGRLLVRGDVGYTQVSDVEELPASIRFFAGGDQSVRGYDFSTLGPTNDDGEVIGGKHLLVGSVEYEQRIKGKWSAAVFYDAGNALNNISDPLRQGIGVGVRWQSPVGLVRVDLGVPLDESEDSVRLHLTIGPDL